MQIPYSFRNRFGFLFLICALAAGFGCAGGSPETPANACGGKTPLLHAPGSECGACSVYECDGTDAVVCRVIETNPCGGCGPLGQNPGVSCGVCGITVCDGTDHVTCQDPGANLCGGCAALQGTPGSACGTCGTWRCDGTEALACEDPGTNACGFCGALPHAVGAACACSEGTWACGSGTDMACVITTPDTRATARDLGNFSDTQDSFFTAYQALFPGEDTEDWFTSYCSDDYFGLMDIRAQLVVPAGHDYDLCVYYDPGRSSSVGCTAGTPSTFDGLNGCCSRNTGTTDEYVELDPDALGTSTDAGRFYYRVTYVSGPGTCSTYQLRYAF